jgi:AraC-like DNA-binding protein
MTFKLLDIINSISVLQLAIFSFFLIHKGRKKLSNNILTAFFIVQLIVIFNFLLLSTFSQSSFVYTKIAFVYYPFEFLWGPLIYFYIKSQVTKKFKFKVLNLIHLIPFLIAILFITFNYYTFDRNTQLLIINNWSLNIKLSQFNWVYCILLFGYNLGALRHIFKYQRNLKEYYSFEIKQNVIWLKFVLLGYLTACTFTALLTLLSKYHTISYPTVMNLMFATFLIFFNILFYKALINPYVLIEPEEKPKYASSILGKIELERYSQIIILKLTTEKLYLNSTLTLNEFSEETGISVRILSQVINQKWNQNFFSFINTFRIEEAKHKLTQFNNKTDTMLGIGFDSGFNSKSSFYDAFKKQTGITPTEYRKKLV